MTTATLPLDAEHKERTERKAKSKKHLQRLKRMLLAAAALHVRTWTDEEQETHITNVKTTADVEVGIISEEIGEDIRHNYLCFWVASREVRIGPLTPDQAEKLCEDLGYAAVK